MERSQENFEWSHDLLQVHTDSSQAHDWLITVDGSHDEPLQEKRPHDLFTASLHFPSTAQFIWLNKSGNCDIAHSGTRAILLNIFQLLRVCH